MHLFLTAVWFRFKHFPLRLEPDIGQNNNLSERPLSLTLYTPSVQSKAPVCTKIMGNFSASARTVLDGVLDSTQPISHGFFDLRQRVFVWSFDQQSHGAWVPTLLDERVLLLSLLNTQTV